MARKLDHMDLKQIISLHLDGLSNRQVAKTLMKALSTFGLDFQLLIISFMLVIGYIDYIVYFFIWYTLMIFVFISIRKLL